MGFKFMYTESTQLRADPGAGRRCFVYKFHLAIRKYVYKNLPAARSGSRKLYTEKENT